MKSFHTHDTELSNFLKMNADCKDSSTTFGASYEVAAINQFFSESGHSNYF